jgi:hypothetical protein
MPAQVWGARVTSQIHYKYSTAGHRELVRIMYGVTPKVTLMITPIFSNFHLSEFPDDLNVHYKKFHNHQANASYYPYVFEGINVYGKWRFYSKDGPHKHFRLALYGEGAYNKSVHLDAFPSLMGDQSGMSAGIIATKLQHKFAISFTSGVTKFFSHTDISTDTVKFTPGNSFTLNLSLGYLLHPRAYTSYRNLNVNVYLEGSFRKYQRPVIYRNDVALNSDQFAYLRSGSAFYIYPAIQLIIDSKTRIDLGAELPLYFSNNLQRYVMGIVTIQRYFY